MERYYYKRDQKIAVEELPDVRAVHLSVDERGVSAAAEADLGASAMDAVRSTVGADTPDDALTAFENANWRFVRPSETLMRSLTASEAVPGAEAVGKVLRRSDGSVAIATNRLNVQLKPELSEHECKTILSEKDLHVRMKLAFAPNLYEVDANGREDALQASVELHDDPRFTFAEPSLTEHIPQRFSPTDPDYMNQWQWRNTGQSGGTAGADVHAEAAWDVTRGAGVRVAVIDNGFDADHEDLAPGVSAMSGFYTAAGGFVQGTAGMPDNNHGTFCAGMVGARQNNGHGGCGAAPQSELMLIAALGDQVGTQTTLARAVAYAGNPQTEVPGSSPGDGADILVSSLGPNGADWDLTTTLDLAIEEVAANGRSGRGLAIFWAASNGANVDVTLDEVVSHPDVIAVVRSNRNDREDNAARGSSVELIAPGVDVYSTRSGDTYGTSTGTSFAAPCAAGCAALALSVNLNLTRDQLREVMRRSADKIGGVTYDANGHNDDYGFGRVNALEAVRQARHPRLVVGNFGYNAGGWRVDRHPRFLADLTGNGRADIVGFGNAGVWVSRNNGDGTFQGPQLVVGTFGYDAGGWRVDRHPRFLADVTGDGRADIVGFGNAGVWVSRNNGDGTFQGPQLVVGTFGYDAGGWRVDRHPRFLADVTGDGRADIVGFGNAGVWVSRNNGDGTFQAPQLVVGTFGYDAGGWRVDRHPRFLADVTGDGRADIVGFGNAGVWVSRNNGDGTFQAPQLVVGTFGYDAGGWRVDRHPRFVVDITGDGRADIVGFGNAGVWVSLNNGDGTFQGPQLVVNNFGYDAGGWRVDRHPRLLGNLTGNGAADIVGFGNAGVWVSRNNGDGTFQGPQMVIGNFGYNAGGWRVDMHPRFLADVMGSNHDDIVGFGNAGVWVFDAQ